MFTYYPINYLEYVNFGNFLKKSMLIHAPLAGVLFLILCDLFNEIESFVNLSQILELFHNNLDFFKVRYDDLSKINEYYANNYFISILLSLFFLPIYSVFISYRYFIEMYSSRSFYRIGYKSIYGTMGVVLFCAAFIFLLYIVDVNVSEPNYTGKLGLFISWIYPVSCGVFTLFVSFAILTTLAFVAKMIIQYMGVFDE